MITKVSVAFITVLISGSAFAEATSTKLVVEVKNVPSTKGHLQCALFKSANGFPDDGKKAIRSVSVVLSKDKPICTFENVTPGVYAVSVRHDENDNNELDTNFFGSPTEAYGASNNKLPSMSAPTWEDSRFEVVRAPTQTIVIRLEH